MIICSFCQNRNLEGELYCQECGNPLKGSPSISTRVLQQQEGQSTPIPQKKAIWGTTRFRQDVSVLMRFDEAKETLTLDRKDRLVIGRTDPQTGSFPDVDLTQYGALDNGVSRAHACFQRTEDNFSVIDLNSVNGTYLNGQRLIPNQPRVLQDGDEVRFGKLVTHIYFK